MQSYSSDLTQQVSEQLNLPVNGVATVVELLDSDNTIPFVARYRKEITGGLDEEQLRNIAELMDRLRSLEDRRQTILKSVDEQGRLTPELQTQLLAAKTLTALEDLYLPYKPKRRTRASVARERGLQPLADMILKQDPSAKDLDKVAAPFISAEVMTTADGWAGAKDIVAETISDHPEVRRITREKAMQWGTLTVSKIEQAQDTRRVYEVYYQYEQRIDRLRPHQVLAINRGEAEDVLRVKVIVPERDWRSAIQTIFRPEPRSKLALLLLEAVEDAASRLLLPSIERDVRNNLSEHGEEQAMRVFAGNLRSLLSQPPLTGHVVLGIDPGFRTGSKIAVVDATGKLLETTTIYPHEPQKRWEQALDSLQKLVERHRVSLIAIGNGTASRETEMLAVELIHRLQSGTSGKGDSLDCRYLIVNEAGASVYSASPLARSELPELDVSLRGAVSIARRVLDPLAELVKIEPKAIGVGMYQHDVDQKRLSATLNGVVESVVNQVGVDANTASPALLTYVAGVGPKLADRIVDHRNQNGPFADRQSLRAVNGLGPKAFEQAAGFLRIVSGENPLDASAIHPESYPVAIQVLRLAGLTPQDSPPTRKPALEVLLRDRSIDVLAKELNTGRPTLEDILEQLVRPGRDPRQESPVPILRSDVLKIEDLVTGMRLKGTVRNVVDFGAFVDLGVKQDGLLHRSQLPAGLVLRVGDIIQVEVIRIEVERGRIALGWAGA